MIVTEAHLTMLRKGAVQVVEATGPSAILQVQRGPRTADTAGGATPKELASMPDDRTTRRTAYQEIDLGRCAGVYDFWTQRGRFGFTYFITELDPGTGEPTDWVKIGLASDPIARLRTLQTGNPRPLTLAALILGDKHTEAALHAHFRGVAFGHTEWFGHGYRDCVLAFAAEIDRRQRAAVTEAEGFWIDDVRLRRELVADVLGGR